MKRGDLIRSFDFEPVPSREECYVEGRVTRVADGFVFFTVTKDVWIGAETPNEITQGSRVGSEMSAPLSDSETIMFPTDWEGRLTVIEEEPV